MRLAYVCADSGVPVFGQKGCSVHVQEMLRAFVRRGLEVDLFAATQRGACPADLAGVRVHDLPRAKGEREALAGNVATARMLAESGPFDFVYERHALWSFAAMEFARHAKVPGLLEINAPLVEEQSRHRMLVDRAAAERAALRAFRAARFLLPVSENVAASLRLDSFNRDKVVVVPNGVDPERFAPGMASAIRPDTSTFVVGFVGSLRPWHGIIQLVDGFACLRERCASARLLVVGDGPMRAELEGALSASGLSDSAKLVGAVRPEQVPFWLGQMDAAVAPYPPSADFYFSPLKILEYMAAGLPVVASDIGQVSEMIRNEESGLLHRPGDGDAMAAQLQRLSASRAMRERIGREARHRILSSCSWQRNADRLIALGQGNRERPSQVVGGVPC